MALNAGQIGQLIFDANAGDFVHIVAVNGNFAAVNGNFGRCAMHLFDPRGNDTNPSSNVNGCSPSGDLFSFAPLPYSGTYTLQVEPQSAGSVSLSLNASTQTTALPLQIDGQPVTVTTTAPGKLPLLTFSGSAGQHLVVTAGNVTYSQCSPLLYDPTGSVLIGGNSCTYLDLGTLPRTGTYKLLLNIGTGTGSASLQL